MQTAIFGKHVVANFYVHRDAISELEQASRAEVWAAEAIADEL